MSPSSRRPKPLRRRGAAAVIGESTPSDAAVAPIVERPDGFYWVAADGHQEFGPFETAELARSDRSLADEEAPAPGESLQEAEQELGMSDWIDPETGEPAEGQSPPHLDES